VCPFLSFTDSSTHRDVGIHQSCDCRRTTCEAQHVTLRNHDSIYISVIDTYISTILIELGKKSTQTPRDIPDVLRHIIKFERLEETFPEYPVRSLSHSYKL